MRVFLYLTAATWALCAVLILWLDRPLALFIHEHTAGLVPFFASFTHGCEVVYNDVLYSRAIGLPLVFPGLGLAYLVGRWGLRRPGAVLFLITLLAHVASIPTANVLKGVVHRLRPEVLFAGGGTGLFQPGPHNDSFPSAHTATYWSLLLPLALAVPGRWRPLVLAVPMLMALGRLVLGAHYLSDVLFSIWLSLGYTVLFGQLRRVA
jgi:membrane-associated phospholipid phosphatase